jgi:nitrous-oxide reductase
MSEHNVDQPADDTGESRRTFLGKIAVGTAAVGAVVACGEQAKPAAHTPAPATEPPPAPPPAEVAAHDDGGSVHIKPGQLDDYYGFWSGGQSGDLRILGIPSMREIKRISVFNRDSATGWGGTDWSKKLLKDRHVGDTHHVHLSYTDGTYDGRWIFVNDKVHARLARVDIESMEVDAIVDIPNAQGTHGIFPQRHKTVYVVANSEYRTPMPNDGTGMDDPTKYGAMHSVIDAEKMEMAFQVLVEANMDLAATDYQGRYSFATCYNSEGGVTLEQMMAKDLDHLYVFDLIACAAAVAEGKVITIGTFDKVIDARGADSAYVIRVPVPKSPHGINISPDGKYGIVAGKLSPTASVVDISKLADAFAGKIKPRDCVIAEPELGLGPLHTAFDGKGNAYTSIFIDSVVCKWNIDKAIAGFGKEKAESAVIEKLDVHYQIGHINASMSETKAADGKWLVALCKFSKDRFLNVGPLHMENDQLIDISGDKMRLVHDGPAYPEPHDAVIVSKDLIHPKKQQQRTAPRFAEYEAWAKEDGVDLMKDSKVVLRPDGSVRVYMTSSAPKFSLTEFRVKSGQTVQVIVTNIDKVEDLSHGFALDKHDVCMLLNPLDTQSYTFVAGPPGLYWYYCPWFCHALHLEMRGRMFIDAKV